MNLLPTNDSLREALHNELHARPTARLHLPALITYVAVRNADISRDEECAHLRALPGQGNLAPAQLQANFVRLRCEGFTVKWERHTEFTRYSIVQPMPAHALLGAHAPELSEHLAVSRTWLQQIPGQTVAAIQLGLVIGDLASAHECLSHAQHWLGCTAQILASLQGVAPGQTMGHSMAVTAFRIDDDGFERVLVIMPDDTQPSRAGRIAQRLLELETYRLMALRGLPVAKQLSPMLAEAEQALAHITTQLENTATSDQVLLDRLVSLAARVELATAQHSFRFSASRAYDALVTQRIRDMREKSIPGHQTLGDFLQRRFSPAMATVAATGQRLASLSERVARTSALLRTRVDIATETQNQLLLEKLTRGQALQLRLQTTVEGLSIAAISYYVVSLVLYGGKALKALGLNLNPELLAGLSVPLVLWAVWRTTRRLHAKLHD